MSNDPKPVTKAKILIVDDQLENLRLLAEILIGQGYEIRKAINGSTALMGVEAFAPDLILLDVNMPELDGYQVCQKLKSNRVTRNIPIIFLSASDQINDKVKAFEVGGVDYITKPFQVLEVLARVKTQIKVKRFHQIRENFSKTIVHDLKNPLSVITIGSSALLRRKCLTDKNLEILKVINSNSQRLDSLLNDLLMVAKMDADRLILHKSEVVITELLTNILKRFKIAAQEKKIKLVSAIPKSPQIVLVDINLLQRAIENLLSNAIKFSKSNSQIEVRIDYEENQEGNDSPSQSQFAIKVIDQGIGIKPELRQQIFECYSTGEYVGGVTQIGLGLSFCKMVAEAHQGEILVEDNHPQGSIFTLRL